MSLSGYWYVKVEMWECPLGRRTVVRSPAPGDDVEDGKGKQDGILLLPIDHLAERAGFQQDAAAWHTHLGLDLNRRRRRVSHRVRLQSLGYILGQCHGSRDEGPSLRVQLL